MNVYKQMINSFVNNPRDVRTVPLTNKAPLWFYVFVKDGYLWVDAAREHTHSSTLAKCRQLKENECDAMLDLYHRRQKGEPVSKEAAETTRNQVYWYGVFAELGL